MLSKSYCVYEPIPIGSDVCWKGAIPHHLCRLTERRRGWFRLPFSYFLIFILSYCLPYTQEVIRSHCFVEKSINSLDQSPHVCISCPSLLQRWAVISKTQMKNANKAFNREQAKNDAKDKKEVCSAILFTPAPARMI